MVIVCRVMVDSDGDGLFNQDGSETKEMRRVWGVRWEVGGARCKVDTTELQSSVTPVWLTDCVVLITLEISKLFHYPPTPAGDIPRLGPGNTERRNCVEIWNITVTRHICNAHIPLYTSLTQLCPYWGVLSPAGVRQDTHSVGRHMEIGLAQSCAVSI